jgi:hypothetical protein
MSWQDDLGGLDQALADGTISADVYRRRRDEILAAAASSPNRPTPDDQPTSRTQGPFAPPFRWTSTSPDTTQVVPGGADATQVVPQNSADATQVVNTGPDERTESLRPTGHRPGPPQWSPAPSPWGDEPESLTPPSPTWLVQGPEVFGTSRASRGRIAGIAVAVLVVVGLIVGGFVLFGHEDRVEGGRATTRPAPRPPDLLAIAALPGTPENHGDVTTFEDAASENFLTAGEVAFYRTAGAGPARLATSTTSAGVHVLVFTAVASSPAAAATARDDLAEQQLIYGMDQSPAPPAGVRVAEVDRTATVPATMRAHYVHDATVVRVQVNGGDLATVRAVFQDVIRAQLTVLAPNG